MILFIISAYRIFSRLLIPLHSLRQKTNLVAQKDFSQPIKFKGQDEFSDLASAFNKMMRKLHKQFNALETMSRIDRLILSTLGMKNIIATILMRMPSVINCDRHLRCYYRS